MKSKLVMSAAAVVTSVVTAFNIDAPQNDNDPSLSAYQRKCSAALGAFVASIPMLDRGQYSVSYGEAFRPESVAKEYARRGIGIAKSLHTQRLAVDLNLFVDGVHVTDSESHKPLADLWLMLGPKYGIEPAAGAYFSKPDGGHYSCARGGVK